MAGDDRVRLFCALQLPRTAVDALAAWQACNLPAGSPGLRIVEPAQLHITLAFLGSRPVAELPRVVEELALAVAAARPVRLQAERYRETRSAGMIVFSDAGEAATALAADLAGRLERIGAYRREQRPWLPHATVARFRERPRLELRPPDLGEVSPSDAAVYSSVLRPTGARYDVLERIALRSATA